MLYNPQNVQAYYDQYGSKEWDRLEQTLQGRIKYAIHKRFLDEFIPDGARVLDVGCGPGRFAIDLARRGIKLTLADISQVQLDLARVHLDEVGLIDRIEAIHQLDLVDMHVLQTEYFDAVVCYGAALSYTCDQYEQALLELKRVLRPGGYLLTSVVSLYGTIELVEPFDDITFLDQPDEHIEWQATLSGAGVVYTRPGSTEVHQQLVMFTSTGFCQALEKAGYRVEILAAANPIVSEPANIPQISASDRASASLTELELALCTCPGLVDSGEHLIAVATKT